MKIIISNNLDELRKLLEKSMKEKEIVAVQAQDSVFNRKVLEMKNINILLNPHLSPENDKLKERSSGLNEVLCRIAAKNNIKIGINLDEISKLEKKEKALLLARIRQNIMLCKKTKAEIVYLGNQDKKAVFSLLLTLGASTSQAKKAIA